MTTVVFLIVLTAVVFICAGIALWFFIDGIIAKKPDAGPFLGFLMLVAFGALLCTFIFHDVREIPIKSDHPASIDTLVWHNGGIVDSTYIYDFTKKPEK